MAGYAKNVNRKFNARKLVNSGAGQRQTKCFVWNPDGSVLCIGYSYGGGPCYCRVYPEKSVIGALRRGEIMIYTEAGDPVPVLVTEEGITIVELPSGETISPLPQVVIEAGGGVIIKDPRSGDVTIEPLGENGEEPSKPGTVTIMGYEMPMWQAGLAAFGIARIFKLI